MSGGAGAEESTEHEIAIAAHIPNLMDRSRFAAGSVSFVEEPDQARGASLIIVDLDRSDDLIAYGSLSGRTVGFCSHVDGDRMAAATDAGFDEVMARSVFFRRLHGLLASPLPPPSGNTR